jgi:phage-related holin
MEKRFIYEFIVGVIGLVAVFLFGSTGMIILVLLVVHPFIGKKKADERESQLFKKAGNITGALTLLACVGIYLASDFVVNGYQIGDSWLFFAVYSFLVAHGASGLIVLKNG